MDKSIIEDTKGNPPDTSNSPVMPNGCEISNCMYESGGGGGSDELIEAARGRHKISGQNVSIHKCKQASM